jgi:glycosyltransferase involved in cell wall biosynthesis
MRIAIIASLFPPFDIGGAEQVAAQLALALRRLGHDVDVISTCRRTELAGAQYRADDWEGIRVWRIAPWNLYWRFDQAREQPNRLSRAAWHAIDLWNPSIFRPLRHVLDQIRPEVINTHNIDGLSPVVWQVARESTEAIVHTLHDYHLLCARATLQHRNGTMCDELCAFCKVYAGYHRLFQSNVRVLVAPALAIAKLHQQSGWHAPRLEIIRNSIDVEPIQPAHIPDTDPLRVLFLSRLEREKGCETLLAVLPRFRESSEIQFHLAGRGSYEKRFSQIAESMPNVIWHGFVAGQDKHDLLSNSDVFLQLSECRENAPLSLIEAKRYGLYLLGTETGGIPEYIGGSETGELIPPGDPERLFQTLLMLPGLKNTLRNGRSQRVRGNASYGTHEMAEEYLRVFRSLAAPS